MFISNIGRAYLIRVEIGDRGFEIELDRILDRFYVVSETGISCVFHVEIVNIRFYIRSKPKIYIFCDCFEVCTGIAK